MFRTLALFATACLCTALMTACSDPAKPTDAASSAIKCVLNTDCPGTAVCGTAKVCVTPGCTSICAAGQACTGGKCMTSSTIDAGNSDGGVSDAGSSDAVSDSAAGTDDASIKPDSGPEDTGTPEKDSGPVVATPSKSCGKCATDVDCGDAAYQCIPLMSGKFCAKKCDTSDTCDPGYKCDLSSSDPKNTQKNCVLPSYDCLGCTTTGCPAGQKCNAKLQTPICAAVKSVCDACNQESDCDAGLRCVKQGDAKVCAPDCTASPTCPATSTCQTFFGIHACAFQADKCCYGASCTMSTKCSACSADKCLGGACVECVKDADCAGGTCNVAVHTCIKDAACAAPTPIKLSATGACVECSNDSHCTGAGAKGPKCDGVTNTCGVGTATSECAACGGAYPGCVQINAVWSCVECVTDKDCADKSKGTCSATKYMCSGSTGTGTGQLTGTCKTDADCVNGPSTTFALKCDVPSGLCYDTEGNCDNLVAFCNAAAGSDCKTGGDLGIPGMPPLPGGGAAGGGGGVCTCPLAGSGSGSSGLEPSGTCKIAMMLDPKVKTCDCGADPKAAQCMFFDISTMAQVECCVAPGSGTPSPLPFDISCLGGLLGGGSGGGTPSPACFGGPCKDACSLADIAGGTKATGKGTCSTTSGP